MARKSNNTALNYLAETVDSTGSLWKIRTMMGSGSCPTVSVTSGSGSVSVANTSTTVMGENLSRFSATFVNDSNEVIYLGLGTAAKLNAGVRLNAAGGSYEINQLNLFSGSVFAISTSGTKNLCFTQITSA